MNTGVWRAAALYFAIIFAAGFVLGALRVFFVVPLLGELFAVLLESPIILLASWLACGGLIRLFHIRGLFQGLVMGAAAFALLIAAEFALSVLVFGRSPVEFLDALATAAGAVGLTGQLAFGLMPLFRSGRSKS